MNETVEKVGLALSLYSPWFFRHVARPILYHQVGPDPEDVHRTSLKKANAYCAVIEANKNLFEFPELEVKIRNLCLVPFGTAAGFDKNGDALKPFSRVFGFMTDGTFLPYTRDGNLRPRVCADNENDEAYNAQGFPFAGLDVAAANLIDYRKSDAPQKPVIASVCTLPYVVRESGRASFNPRNRVVIADDGATVRYKEFSEIPDAEIEKALENAIGDFAPLLDVLEPLVDGFEWDPFSPNTKTLGLLRNPKMFFYYSYILSQHANGKLTQVKMGPYEQKDTENHLQLCGAWLKGGCDGVTAVNTYAVARDQVPAKEWGPSMAGRSGSFLAPYRRRFIEDTREAFPSAIIFATGGINNGPEAYDSFDLGADAVEGCTASYFNGLGLQRELMSYVAARLKQDNCTLQQFIHDSHTPVV